MKYLLIVFTAFLFLARTNAQYIVNGTDTLFGNEWINHGQAYFKIKLAQDGIYRVTGQALSNAGVPIDQIPGEKFQLWHNSEQMPLYTTTNGVFSNADYFEFFGKKNTSELDHFLFADPDSMMMNPLYSMFTDTAAYFLTWSDNANGPRYETADNNLTNLPPKEDYYMANLVLVNSAIAYKEATADGVSMSHFTMAEGFASNYSVTNNYTLNPTAIYAGSVEGKLDLRFAGRHGQHQQVISLNNQAILTVDFKDYQVQFPTITLDNSQLAPTMALKMQGMASANDLGRVAYVSLNYPRTFDFEAKKSYSFNIPASNSVKYLEIANFDVSGGTPILYDLTNAKRMVGVMEGGVIKIALPPSTSDRNLVLVNDNSGFNAVTELIATPFVDFRALDHDFIIVTSKRLLDDGNGNNRVQEYADYRASQAGGSYNPIVVEVEQLYDQFSWGVERHPFSVRNFGLFVKENWASAQYLFIIGKAIEYKDVRSSQNLTNLNSFFYVPTYSQPGADNLILSGHENKAPILPISRISARSGDEIKSYLEKVKEFEGNATLPQTIEDRGWMKRILHLGGGNTPGEQSSIKSNLTALEAVIENNKFGAEVTSFYKTSTDPIQQSQSEQLIDIIRTGVSIITFFGHSGVNSFDFSIDRPEKFLNKGKYPFMFPLGCNTGNIHTIGFGADQRGISEEFIFTPESGAIGFGATSSYGYVHSLYTFMERFYKHIGNDYYGESVGEIIQKTIASFDQNQDFGLRLLLQQFTLNGDPSIKINPTPGPDFTIDRTSVSISPSALNAQLDSFSFSINLVNLGQNKQDTVVVEVRREFPDGTEALLFREQMQAPAFKDVLRIKTPVGGESATGMNHLFVHIDAENQVDELPLFMAEENNELVSETGQKGYEFFVRSNTATPVFPHEFSIVNKEEITLVASSSDVFAPSQKYLFELDTTELFNSPTKLQYSIQQSGGLLKWKVPFTPVNESVYYWRVSPDSTENGSYSWKSSSFIYLSNGSEGWNQSHRYQYLKDEFENMELAPGGSHFKFIDDVKDLKIENGVYPNHLPLFLINNTRTQSWVGGTVDAGVYVVVLDSVSVLPWENPPGGLYGSYNVSTTRTLKAFPFKTNSADERLKLIQFLQDVVPDENYVLFFTIQQSSIDYKPAEWAADSLTLGTNLFQVLEAQGANKIRSTATNGASPYAFFFQKNKPAFTGGGEYLVTTDERIDANFPVEGQWNSGAVESVLIGPAKTWERLEWKVDGFQASSDTISISLIGVSKSLADSVLIEHISSFDTALASLSADVFPYLRLRFNSSDPQNRTSPQLVHWRVQYEPLPEAALNPAASFAFHNDTLSAGEPLKLSIRVDNLTDKPMDSLLVHYVVTESSRNEVRQYQQRVAPINGLDSLQLNFETGTAQFLGKQRLFIEINPDGDQPEQFHFNNYGQFEFFVEGDARNPLLDVTFDGVHILDGDIVSTEPLVVLTLRDENKFLPLGDTSIFQLFVKYPDETEPRPISLAADNVRFFPAALNSNGTNNKARLEFNPKFTQDGIYQLIVQAKDVSGNQSGSVDFKVNFEVVNKSSISNLLNYPNPFSTSTRFLYTLTGKEPPAFFKIQILTIAGRVVREINQDEIGEMKVGTHLTDFAWDGTDEFGDRLANGVYLYRVLAKDSEGKDWELRETGADEFTQKGFGKMVIVR